MIYAVVEIGGTYVRLLEEPLATGKKWDVTNNLQSAQMFRIGLESGPIRPAPRESPVCALADYTLHIDPPLPLGLPPHCVLRSIILNLT